MASILLDKCLKRVLTIAGYFWTDVQKVIGAITSLEKPMDQLKDFVGLEIFYEKIFVSNHVTY